jgi:hypothetical protein
LDEDNIRSFLNELKDKELIKHYVFVDEIKCAFEKSEDVSSFIKSNKPISMKFENNIIYYNIVEFGGEDVVFDIDISDSFAKSDKWLFEHITPVGLVFPNLSSSSISTEMSSFYTTLVMKVLGQV